MSCLLSLLLTSWVSLSVAEELPVIFWRGRKVLQKERTVKKPGVIFHDDEVVIAYSALPEKINKPPHPLTIAFFNYKMEKSREKIVFAEESLPSSIQSFRWQEQNYFFFIQDGIGKFLREIAPGKFEYAHLVDLPKKLSSAIIRVYNEKIHLLYSIPQTPYMFEYTTYSKNIRGETFNFNKQVMRPIPDMIINKDKVSVVYQDWDKRTINQLDFDIENPMASLKKVRVMNFFTDQQIQVVSDSSSTYLIALKNKINQELSFFNVSAGAATEVFSIPTVLDSFAFDIRRAKTGPKSGELFLFTTSVNSGNIRVNSVSGKIDLYKGLVHRIWKKIIDFW